MGASLTRIRLPHLQRPSVWRPHALILVVISLPVLAEMGLHNGSWRPASAATRAGLAARPQIALGRTASLMQVSPDGRIGAVTLTQGNGADDARHIVLMEVPSGRVIDDLQRFSLWRRGQQVEAHDVIIRDIAFTSDSNVFYASVTEAGQSYRVRGDIRQRELRAITN